MKLPDASRPNSSTPFLPTRRPPLLHLASHVFDTPLAIVPEKLEAILAAVGPRLVTDQAALTELVLGHVLRTTDDVTEAEFLANYSKQARTYAALEGFEATNESEQRGYRRNADGIALIQVSGALMESGTWMSSLSGFSSYTEITDAINGAMQDETVAGVLFLIDSPGGSTHGVFQLSDTIYGHRGTKPMYSVAKNLAASAAYAIASATDKVFVSLTGAVGSVGVFSIHCDQSGADEQNGVKYTYVYFGDKKTDGNAHEALSRSAKSDIQKEVDREGDLFVAKVARNRGAAVKDIAGTQAGLFFADNAVPLLADQVGTFQDALAELTSKVKGTNAKIPKQGKPSGKSGGKSGKFAESTAESGAESSAESGAESNSDATSAQPTEPTAPVQPDANAANGGNKQMVIDLATARKKVAAANAALAQAELDEAELLAAQAGGSGAPPNNAGDPDDKDKDKDEDDKDKDKDKGSKGKSDKSEKKGERKADDTDNSARTGSGTGSGTGSMVASPTQVIEYCSIAGMPELALGFINEGATMAMVTNKLQEKRSTLSGENAVFPAFGTSAPGKPLDAMFKQAQTIATNSGGTISQSQALERVLRSNPQLYMDYNSERQEALLSDRRRERYMANLTPQLRQFGLSVGA